MAFATCPTPADVLDPAWLPLEAGDLVWLRRPAAVSTPGGGGATADRQDLPGAPAGCAGPDAWRAAAEEADELGYPLSREAFARFVDRLFA